MEFKYTVDDLASKCKVSKQSVYYLLSKTGFFGDDPDFIKKHTTKKSRKVLYSQEVMDKLLAYYTGEQAENQETVSQDQAPDSQHQASDDKQSQEKSSVSEDVQAQITALTAERDEAIAEQNRLKSALEDLNARLKKTEDERLELLKQNGLLALTLQQSQQEKLLLLPAPKKGFFERRRERKALEASIREAEKKSN